MQYNFREIEEKWQAAWKESGIYHISNSPGRPKYYVLDMFPYPSGAGLHVGHPLGYIASDIYARYKRLKGFNVLHPIGFDSFGLPAEQYAIETGQHPAMTTEKNIATFKSQLDKIGFCYDWSREIKTSDPTYYRWTQWIFLQLFKSWYNPTNDKAESIETLVSIFETSGSATCLDTGIGHFSAEEWKSFDEKKQQEILMDFRLAFSSYGEVNWCEALGTVLANDEVVNGVSERGGHPVEKKKMRQWYLRITDYADRLLKGLETVQFSDAMKEMQKNWIGRSEGAEMVFSLNPSPLSTCGEGTGVRVYTTRPDTIFGVDFLVLAPEHELVGQITTEAQQASIHEYLTYVKSRSDRERLAEVKQITGCFTGAYAVNPFDGKDIPIWIAEYVLSGYGTGAIMAVPCGDQRDFEFARHFNIPVTNIIGEHFNGREANPTKDAVLENSGFLNGLLMKDAISVATRKIEELGIGKRKVNYRMRDAGFSRQRYWGEPFPIIWSDGIAIPLDEKELPLELPFVEKYGPGKNGEGPLSNLTDWVNLTSVPSPWVERGEAATSPPSPLHRWRGGEGAALVPKYKVSSPTQYELAKAMRKDYTKAEDKLWQKLRNNQLGVKFRRQHPIESYIADFISLHDNLIVEVDGGYHENEEQQIYDEERTKRLNEIGFHVIRFSNTEVLENILGVLKTIRDIVIPESKKRAEKKAENSELTSPLSIHGEGTGVRETSTMPGYAGSSWYFLRYMDPHNNETFADRKATDYWNQVDVYIGGTEHAVGHLLYSRLWTKVLYDLGYISFDEPFKKLVNQGMIQGSSRFVYRVNVLIEEDKEGNIFESEFNNKVRPVFISHGLFEKYFGTQRSFKDKWDYFKKYYFEINALSDLENIDFYKLGTSQIHVDVNLVDGVELDIAAFKKSKPEYANAEFILENGKYICGVETEKMSKSKYNTVNPDVLVQQYGADTFRMYEMFLGPVEQSKPWDTKGIEGVHRFLKKLWRLFFDDSAPLSAGGSAGGEALWRGDGAEGKATPAELKTLHKAIKKIEEDTARFSFNTAVSAFMVCVNELTDLKCHKKEILEPLLILLTPYAPHIAEELYHALGNRDSILNAAYPQLENKYLVEADKEYPISINGKLRTTMILSLEATQEEVEKFVSDNEIVQKWLDGKTPKKIIYIKNKMVNVVI